MGERVCMGMFKVCQPSTSGRAHVVAPQFARRRPGVLRAPVRSRAAGVLGAPPLRPRALRPPARALHQSGACTWVPPARSRSGRLHMPPCVRHGAPPPAAPMCCPPPGCWVSPSDLTNPTYHIRGCSPDEPRACVTAAIRQRIKCRRTHAAAGRGRAGRAPVNKGTHFLQQTQTKRSSVQRETEEADGRRQQAAPAALACAGGRGQRLTQPACARRSRRRENQTRRGDRRRRRGRQRSPGAIAPRPRARAAAKATVSGAFTALGARWRGASAGRHRAPLHLGMGTGQGLAFQISSAYSVMVRSVENLPVVGDDGVCVWGGLRVWVGESARSHQRTRRRIVGGGVQKREADLAYR